MIKYYCDCCGEEVDYRDRLDNTFDLPVSYKNKDKSTWEILYGRKLLCRDCVVSFIDMLNKFINHQF